MTRRDVNALRWSGNSLGNGIGKRSGSLFDSTPEHNALSFTPSTIIMPPRKKQKVEHSTASAPVVATGSLPPPSWRTTRAMAKAVLAPTSESQPVSIPAASRARKGGATRVVGKPRKGHLYALPEIAVEIQLEVNVT